MAGEPRRVSFLMTFRRREGGAENVLWSFLRHVDRTRIEPLVVFAGDGPFEREVADLGIRTAVVTPSRLRQLRRVARGTREVARILRRERPDLHVSWLTKGQLYGGPAAALSGMRRRNVWWQHDFPARRPADRVAAALPTLAIGACSEAVAAEQRRALPRRPCFAYIAGIEEPARLDERELARRRAEVGLPDGPVVGIVGRLIPWKAQDRFLAALALVREAGHDAHGLVVGGDAYGHAPDFPPYLRRRAAELGIADHVTFTGQVGDATAMCQLMDVSVNASAREPYGLVVLEAMALGVPVVAVAAGGPAEIVEDGRSGLLVSSNEPPVLAAGVARLLSDPELGARLSRGGVERYRSRFTAVRAARDLERRLEALCQGDLREAGAEA